MRNARSSHATFSFFTAALAVCVGLTGCDGGSGGGGGANVVDTVLPAADGKLFIVDPNQRGEAPRILETGMFWGRLVNVFTSDDVEILHDFVIGDNIQDQTGKYDLEINPVTEETRLTLLDVHSDDVDDPDFFNDVIGPLEDFLAVILRRDLEDLNDFSLAPRNSAVVIRFDDLLKASSVNRENLRLTTGYPPESPFEARIFADPNHGDLADRNGDGIGEFYSTRVIIDTTVSAVEGLATGLPVNSLGLPASINTSQANIAIRIPSRTDPTVGQLSVLQNLTDHGPATNGNGDVDFDAVTNDVFRAMRSGGSAQITQDINNGFLRDLQEPQLLGSQQITVTASRNPLLEMIDGNPNPCFNPTAPADVVALDLAFAFASCATTPKVGDVIQQGGVFGEVAPQTPTAPDNGGEISCLWVRMLPIAGEIPSFVLFSSAEYLTAFDPVTDGPFANCFMRFSPNPLDPANPQLPTEVQLTVRFSEPMDPNSLTPFGSMSLTRSQEIELDTGQMGFLPEHFVVGQVLGSADLREFTFFPSLPLNHLNGEAEDYFFNLGQGVTQPTDLAGNPVKVTLPQVNFELLSNEPTQRNGGFVMRFGAVSEFNNDNSSVFPKDDLERPEVRGQLLYDILNGRILPRPVERRPAIADRTKPVPSVMTAFAAGVQTPLTPLGSKLQTLWRYYDVGWSLADESNHNVDIEGLNWSPTSGGVDGDTYEEFEIRLSHSRFLPDEDILTTTLFPKHPDSGLSKTYNANLLDPLLDPQVIVHPRALGYTFDGSELFPAATGTLMMPYPLNRGIPIEEYRYWTWRDTAVQSVGGPNGVGADTDILATTLNDGVTLPGVPYAVGNVPTIGLPILMEFRCYPFEEGLGQNSFDISLAVNSSSRPNFRAFSSGGVNASNSVVIKDPDLQSVANGGFNAGSGVATRAVDNSFYIGQADIVIRVSRVHSMWFPARDPGGGEILTPFYLDPVVEPRPEFLPTGTELQLDFRGATATSGGLPLGANFLDPYGEPVAGGGTVNYFNNDNTWKSRLSDLDGAKWFQFRLTFVSNTATRLTSELSALGFAYEQ